MHQVILFVFRCFLASLKEGLSVHPQVRPSVGPPVRPSEGPLVRWSVRNSFSQKMRDASYGRYRHLFWGQHLENSQCGHGGEAGLLNFHVRNRFHENIQDTIFEWRRRWRQAESLMDFHRRRSHYSRKLKRRFRRTYGRMVLRTFEQTDRWTDRRTDVDVEVTITDMKLQWQKANERTQWLMMAFIASNVNVKISEDCIENVQTRRDTQHTVLRNSFIGG